MPQSFGVCLASSDAITALVCALVVRLENNSPSKKEKPWLGYLEKMLSMAGEGKAQRLNNPLRKPSHILARFR